MEARDKNNDTSRSLSISSKLLITDRPERGKLRDFYFPPQFRTDASRLRKSPWRKIPRGARELIKKTKCSRLVSEYYLRNACFDIFCGFLIHPYEIPSYSRCARDVDKFWLTFMRFPSCRVFRDGLLTRRLTLQKDRSLISKLLSPVRNRGRTE